MIGDVADIPSNVIDIEIVSHPTWPLGRLFVGVAYLVNPMQKMRYCNFLGSFTAGRNLVQATPFPDLALNFQIVFLHFCVCSPYLLINLLSVFFFNFLMEQFLFHNSKMLYFYHLSAVYSLFLRVFYINFYGPLLIIGKQLYIKDRVL